MTEIEGIEKKLDALNMVIAELADLISEIDPGKSGIVNGFIRRMDREFDDASKAVKAHKGNSGARSNQ